MVVFLPIAQDEVGIQRERRSKGRKSQVCASFSKLTFTIESGKYWSHFFIEETEARRSEETYQGCLTG